ncbi:unnamed protein product [Bursaphelenchus okinawaensis]|uniref:Uncharacterized protein n=1 Tax=Bursaphelenchus okinawaensis TaxID=465554 RepID=A0A811KAB6_9BILA|nr:unnamed protein product [Bursaphelenchus okinawaensis]CAG9097288.1 unnamed protein product [Bursaphelenchus okinawaensis]
MVQSSNCTGVVDMSGVNSQQEQCGQLQQCQACMHLARKRVVQPNQIAQRQSYEEVIINLNKRLEAERNKAESSRFSYLMIRLEKQELEKKLKKATTANAQLEARITALSTELELEKDTSKMCVAHMNEVRLGAAEAVRYLQKALESKQVLITDSSDSFASMINTSFPNTTATSTTTLDNTTETTSTRTSPSLELVSFDSNSAQTPLALRCSCNPHLHAPVDEQAGPPKPVVQETKTTNTDTSSTYTLQPRKQVRKKKRNQLRNPRNFSPQCHCTCVCSSTA